MNTLEKLWDHCWIFVIFTAEIIFGAVLLLVFENDRIFQLYAFSAILVQIYKTSQGILRGIAAGMKINNELQMIHWLALGAKLDIRHDEIVSAAEFRKQFYRRDEWEDHEVEFIRRSL